MTIPYPPDTTTYWRMNETGNLEPHWRGWDSTLYKGQLIVRFRQGALDYPRLLAPYFAWYRSLPFPSDSDRGFPESLKHTLKLQRFYIDSTSNIILDSGLRFFLHYFHAHYLRRLTTASPFDTISITRRGDTIGCDLYDWMVLDYDTTVNPILLSYLLMTGYSKDIRLAEPDRHSGKFLHAKPSHPGDNRIYYDSCQFSLRSLINAPKAWDYEIGRADVVLALYEQGVDYMHPDLGAGLGLDKHVRFGEQFCLNLNPASTWGPFDFVNQHQGHGTPVAGIMSALTNRNATSVAGIAGGWGICLPNNLDTVDEGMGCSVCILAGSNFGNGTATASYSNYVAGIFQAAAKSPTTEFGFGVNAINSSLSIEDDYSSVHAAINFAFLNGVVQVASINANDHDESDRSITTDAWPANYDESWMISVGGSKDDKTLIPGSDFGYTMDFIAPAGDPTAGPVVTSDTFGYIKCSDNDHGHNWDVTFSIANDQKDSALLERTNPRFRYLPTGGNSAAAPHATGSAGLLLSTFFNDTTKLTPEDVGGILKASAFRAGGVTSYQKRSGWGHLDIGHAYEMLDQTPGTSTQNLYFLRHYHFENDIDTSTPWGRKLGYLFQICWDSSIVVDTITKKYSGKWQYLLDNDVAGTTYPAFTYLARPRPVFITVTLDSIWDVNPDAPLYAWGRSGGRDDKSGWNFSQDNWQTGWSRVVSCTGGDTLNEGIFHSQGVTFRVMTAQYDVWAWDKDSNDFKKYIGHVPDDTMLGVNFSVFGRRNLSYNAVQSEKSLGNETLIVSVNQGNMRLDAQYLTDAVIQRPVLEIYDILGRKLLTHDIPIAEQGWNKTSIPISNLISGTYICRLSGSNFMKSRSFQILR